MSEFRILRVITDGNHFTDRLQHRENLLLPGMEQAFVTEWKDVPVVEHDTRQSGPYQQ